MYTGMSQGPAYPQSAPGYSISPTPRYLHQEAHYSLDAILDDPVVQYEHTMTSHYAGSEYAVSARAAASPLEHILCDVQAAKGCQKSYITRAMLDYLVDDDPRKNYENHDHHNQQVLSFISPSANPSDLVTDIFDVREYVQDIFKKVTGHQFPNDIEMHILSEDEFFKVHASHRGDMSKNVLGFSLNRRRNGGMSQVFVREAPVEEVLIVIGHEIGHVLSLPLERIEDEEAKAFAFEYAWVKAMIEYDFAGLKEKLQVPEPAKNGLHDIASAFVMDLIAGGKRALRIFRQIIAGDITVRNARF